MQAALVESGNADRGAGVFRKQADRSLCLNCHRLGNEGGKIGPDLTGIDRRFSRIYIIESILDPSRTVAPSYGSHVVALDSGLITTGVKISENEQTLVLGDAEGKIHEIKKSEIEERSEKAISIMPVGIEKRISQREFVDLIAFLVSQKSTGP
jgi:putative heme-binding domain-containing protein